MPLLLEYTPLDRVPVEVEGLTPDRTRSMSLAEVERHEIFHGNRRVPLAELFRISGDPADGAIHFVGDLSGVHRIGAGMTTGSILVQGSVGRHTGADMSGGTITIEGDASDWLGAEMLGGRILVRGNAGHLVGAAYRGARRGMQGGEILIAGHAGTEVGRAMRRGMLFVGGSVGDALGYEMLAGTIVVGGSAGARTGGGMRRGTIVLLSGEHPPLLPTFRYACRLKPPFLGMTLARVRSDRFALDESAIQADFDLHHGDFLSLGRGEIFVRVH
ncbi:MAG: formylmethanofuran dehydrogenase subunit C [Pirellulales bacterium]|nr:formylmethanofuran dehydrogenase subunit C [Pirellulales bacterium]